MKFQTIGAGALLTVLTSFLLYGQKSVRPPPGGLRSQPPRLRPASLQAIVLQTRGGGQAPPIKLPYEFFCFKTRKR